MTVSTRRITSRGTVHAMAPLGVDYLCGRKAEEPFIWTEERVTCGGCKRLVHGLAVCECGDYRTHHLKGRGACRACECRRFKLDHEDDDA